MTIDIVESPQVQGKASSSSERKRSSSASTYWMNVATRVVTDRSALEAILNAHEIEMERSEQRRKAQEDDLRATISRLEAELARTTESAAEIKDTLMTKSKRDTEALNKAEETITFYRNKFFSELEKVQELNEVNKSLTLKKEK